jgi:predicted ATP-dependent endonuclease of OLD family
MKLKEFRVPEFRRVWGSGLIVVDEKVTCLFGKNEAGKTALLTAL